MEIMIPAWIDGVLKPVEKLEVHRRGLRHKAISVFVNCDGRTLLQRRAEGKYHTPGRWSNACCTHPAWGESARDCAARRLREELGLAAPELEHRGRVTYRAEVGGGLIEHEEVEMFAWDLAQPVEPEPDPDEVSDTRWIAFGALREAVTEDPQAFTPWLAIYLARHGDLVEAR